MSWFFDYPQNWNEIRREVYKKDNWTCQKCGAKNTKLYAHHLIPLFEGGSNELKNLVTLCEECHKDMHFHMRYGKIIGTLTSTLTIIYFLLRFIHLIPQRLEEFVEIIMIFLIGIGFVAVIFISIIGFIKTNKAKRELLQKIRTNQTK